MATYLSKGRISEMSEVKSGTSANGYEWQRMTLTLEIPGFQGAVTKQVFQVSGDDVNDVLRYSIGDKVEVTWSMYAREWNGRWYNNVDLVKIKHQEETRQEAAAARPAQVAKHDALSQDQLNPAEHPDDLPF